MQYPNRGETIAILTKLDLLFDIYVFHKFQGVVVVTPVVMSQLPYESYK